MVSLAQLTGGTPSQKGWLSIVADNTNTNVNYNKYQVGTIPPSLTVGSAVLNLTTAYFPSGITRLDGTGNVVCPTSATIDAALEIKTDGWTIWQDFVNVNTGGTQQVIPPDGGAAVTIPYAATGNRNAFVRLYFTRIGGVWTCVST